MKVLLMSGYTEEMTGPHGGPESETPFIEKPFSTVTLAEKVRQVLDRRA